MFAANGTPTNLKQAMVNAGLQVGETNAELSRQGKSLLLFGEENTIYKSHARDYIAQAFSAAILNAELHERFEEAQRLQLLFNKLTGEE